MVDAAERLIAQHGLAAVSLRDVQAEAGQRNKSAANYHFGSRDGLIAAIVEARMEPINKRRMAMLADLDMLGRSYDLRSLVDALVIPLAEATLGRRDGSFYARFLAQLITDPATVALTRKHLWAESFLIVCERLAGCLTGVPADFRSGRIDRIIGLVVFSLAAWEGGWIQHSTPVRARIPDLVDSCVALAESPLSTITRVALEDGELAGSPR